MLLGPPELAVERVAVREQPIRDALADDDDEFAAFAIVGGEIATGDDGHADDVEEAGRDDPQPAVRILLAVRRRMPLDCELDSAAEAAGIAARAKLLSATPRTPGRAARRCATSL